MYRVLINPTKIDIYEYPISECQLDEEGNPLMDPETQQSRDTGTTKVWSLAAGETLRFPKYVADILMDRFQFLRETQRNIKTEAVSEDAPEFVPGDGHVKCGVCGIDMSNVKALAMHMGSKHPEEILRVTGTPEVA
jgi:hypothetical protein